MLVLSRHRDQRVMIGKDITVQVLEIRGDKVRLGIQAPADIAVHREEVFEAIAKEEAKRSAAAESGRDAGEGDAAPEVEPSSASPDAAAADH